MPTYEYRCDNGHTFEVFQRMADDPVERCEVCEGPVERVFHPVAVHFKGSGFYTTDYARKDDKRSGTDGKDGAGKKDSDSKSESGSKGDAASKGSDSGEKSKAGADK
jgi:putative FmdB family regulatory protein